MKRKLQMSRSLTQHYPIDSWWEKIAYFINSAIIINYCSCLGFTGHIIIEIFH